MATKNRQEMLHEARQRMTVDERQAAALEMIADMLPQLLSQQVVVNTRMRQIIEDRQKSDADTRKAVALENIADLFPALITRSKQK